MSENQTSPAINTATVVNTAKIDLTHFLLSHAIWVAAVAVAIVFGNVALREHDERIAAEAAIKVSQANIEQLQSQIKTTDAAAAQKVQTIVKIVHDLGPAPTPTQVVTAIPQLTDIPLNTRAIPNDPVDVEVAAQPLLDLVQQAATDKINLAACQSDLKAETAIAAQKDTQIAALKKKPKFLNRVKHVFEAVGVGIAIGAVLGAHL